MKELTGWGRYPVARAPQIVSEDLERATGDAVLSRGLGRSYGDSSLPANGRRPVVCTRLADRVLAFDPETGRLRAEAGLSLDRLNTLFLPRRWFTPVTPGTQFVTLGGMVASDVHGKNHHVAGCFGEHVRALKMRVADGRVLEIGDEREPELFRATIGGMGLTGHILEVDFRMERIPSPWIFEETERMANLGELIRRLREASHEWPFTVAWVDCLRRGSAMGRGILIKGRWATAEEAPAAPPGPKRRVTVPLDMPGWLLNTLSIRAFNTLYFHKSRRRPHRRIVDPESFFYPLDMLLEWNRLYGKRGFTQYQCVLPPTEDGAAYREFFEALTRHGGASFLSVIKDCGKQGKGMLSFPMPGVSVALDLPLRPDRTQALVDALNEIVIRAGGRIYLTKDALSRPEHFRAMEPRLDGWNAVRRKWDPDGRIVTAQSVRLLGDRA